MPSLSEARHFEMGKRLAIGLRRGRWRSFGPSENTKKNIANDRQIVNSAKVVGIV